MEGDARIHHPGRLHDFLFHGDNRGAKLGRGGHVAGADCPLEDPQIAGRDRQRFAGAFHYLKVGWIPLRQRLPDARTGTVEMRNDSIGRHYRSLSVLPACRALFTMAWLTSMEFT